MGLVAVLPVHDEFWNQRTGEFRIDMGHHQNVEHILGWIPLLTDSLGFGAVLQGGVEFDPLDPNMLDKF